MLIAVGPQAPILVGEIGLWLAMQCAVRKRWPKDVEQ